MPENKTEITNFDIEVKVPIVLRTATCDFCGQGEQKCFHSPNSFANDKMDGRDICKKCVEQMAKNL